MPIRFFSGVPKVSYLSSAFFETAAASIFEPFAWIVLLLMIFGSSVFLLAASIISVEMVTGAYPVPYAVGAAGGFSRTREGCLGSGESRDAEGYSF